MRSHLPSGTVTFLSTDVGGFDEAAARARRSGLPTEALAEQGRRAWWTARDGMVAQRGQVLDDMCDELAAGGCAFGVAVVP